jgi:hypothetical protein
LALAVVESTRWAKYTLVSRRIQGGRPSEASSTVVAGGLKQAAIMELILLAGDADLICDAVLRATFMGSGGGCGGRDRVGFGTCLSVLG